MKKLFAGIAAVALAASLSAGVSAADWSAATFADNDPETVNILSYDEDSITFEEVNDSAITKVAINLADVLEDPADLDRIYEGSWKLTYHGLSSLSGTEIGWLGGGAYCATGNSNSHSLAPNDYDENGAPIWEDEQTVEDSFKWLLPSSKPASIEDATFVFMDWSNQPLKSNGITITLSDFVLKDADGNIIPQKSLSAAAEEAPAEEVVEEVAEEAAPVEEAAPAAEEAAPAPVAATTSTATGNASAAAVAAVMAAAAVAAAATRKK